jgi:hypothetical protein
VQGAYKPLSEVPKPLRLVRELLTDLLPGHDGMLDVPTEVRSHLGPACVPHTEYTASVFHFVSFRASECLGVLQPGPLSVIGPQPIRLGYTAAKHLSIML